jgi:hypothetical protein
MPVPNQCPVCGSPEIEQVMKKASLSLSLGNGLDRVCGVLAFRCPNGHVFLTVPDSDRYRRPLPNTA